MKLDMLSLPVYPESSRFWAAFPGLPAEDGNLPVFNETQTNKYNFIKPGVE